MVISRGEAGRRVTALAVITCLVVSGSCGGAGDDAGIAQTTTDDEVEPPGATDASDHAPTTTTARPAASRASTDPTTTTVTSAPDTTVPPTSQATSTAVPPPPSTTTAPPAPPTTEAPPPPPTVPSHALPAWTGSAGEIGADLARRMTGVSWHEGCPVPLTDLRHLRLDHVGFDGRRHTGELVVHADAAAAVLAAFRHMYDARFPIERVALVEEAGGDDDAAMAANLTTAFNCRRVTGGSGWSEHSFGRAIDINPVQNPYVSSGGTVLPPAGGAHLDRSAGTIGLIVEGGPAVAAFDAVGWQWGGRWRTIKDYQHFSASGR